MPSITIDMDDRDFDHLWHTSMRWCSTDGRNDWTEQESRFETLQPDEEINWQFKYVYWIGEEYTSVILARAYLISAGQEHQVLWDMADNPPSWVILTDYITAMWLRAKSFTNDA